MCTHALWVKTVPQSVPPLTSSLGVLGCHNFRRDGVPALVIHLDAFVISKRAGRGRAGRGSRGKGRGSREGMREWCGEGEQVVHLLSNTSVLVGQSKQAARR